MMATVHDDATDRYPRHTTRSWLAVGTVTGGIALMLFWSLASGGFSVGMQTWMLRVASESAEIETAVNVSVFNFAIAPGAIAVDVTITGAIAIGGVLSALALIVVVRHKHHTAHQ